MSATCLPLFVTTKNVSRYCQVSGRIPPVGSQPPVWETLLCVIIDEYFPAFSFKYFVIFEEFWYNNYKKITWEHIATLEVKGQSLSLMWEFNVLAFELWVLYFSVVSCIFQTRWEVISGSRITMWKSTGSQYKMYFSRITDIQSSWSKKAQPSFAPDYSKYLLHISRWQLCYLSSQVELNKYCILWNRGYSDLARAVDKILDF